MAHWKAPNWAPPLKVPKMNSSEGRSLKIRRQGDVWRGHVYKTCAVELGNLVRLGLGR